MAWFRRIVVGLLLLVAVALVVFFSFAPGYVERRHNSVLAHEPYPVSARAAALHADLVVTDWHADSLLWKRDLLKRGTRGQVDLPRLQDGNVALQVFTAVTKSPAGQNYTRNSADTLDNITLLAIAQLWPPRTWTSLTERALYQADKLHAFSAASDGALRIVTSRADLDALLADRAAGRPVVGGLLGIEGMHALDGDLANLDRLEAAGYRLIGLHHFFDNALGGSLHGTGDQGLTDFGRQVVSEAVRRGMVLDLAHSSPQVVRDVLAMTDIPLVVSHGGLHSHCAVKRNIPDDLMIRVAQTGGVIGIGYWQDVLCARPDPAAVAATVKAAIDVVGEDHVSLGSDFDGSVETAFDVSELPALTDALLEAGLSEAAIRKVMGENMLRVLRARLD